MFKTLFKKITENNKLQQIKNYIIKNKWFSLFILLLILSNLGLFTIGTIRTETNKYLTVTGSSVDYKKNELATFNVTVQSEKEDKADAITDANNKAERIIQAVRRIGVLKEDVKTSNMSVYQKQEQTYEDGVQSYKKTDWVANINTEVVLRDIDKSQELTEKLALLDIESLHGPRFDIDRSELDETGLLKAALEDAENKAKFIAKDRKQTLGGVLSIVEGYAGTADGPVMFERGGLGGGGGMEPGTSKASKTVTVTYKLY